MQDKKYIVILGAGESGVGAALLAQKQGYEVFVSDMVLSPKNIVKSLSKLISLSNRMGIRRKESCRRLKLLKVREFPTKLLS